MTSQNEEMSISIDYYNPETLFVMIHGLKSRQGAKGFAESLRERKKDKITTSFFEISSENYAIIQIHKNFEMYLNTDLTKSTKQDKSRKTSKEKTKAPKKLNKTSKLNSTKDSK